jgi:hypothetical protein
MACPRISFADRQAALSVAVSLSRAPSRLKVAGLEGSRRGGRTRFPIVGVHHRRPVKARQGKVRAGQGRGGGREVESCTTTLPSSSSSPPPPPPLPPPPPPPLPPPPQPPPLPPPLPPPSSSSCRRLGRGRADARTGIGGRPATATAPIGRGARGPWTCIGSAARASHLRGPRVGARL